MAQGGIHTFPTRSAADAGFAVFIDDESIQNSEQLLGKPSIVGKQNSYFASEDHGKFT